MTFVDDPKILRRVIATTGTPTYVYDLDGIEVQANEIQASLPSNSIVVNFFEPANRCSPVLEKLQKCGLGITVTRQRGAERAMQIGYSPKMIDCSGFATTDEELEYFVSKDIRVNLSSEWEIERCSDMYPGHLFGVRIDLTSDGREKRGLDPQMVSDVLAASSIRLKGLHTYLGTGIMSVKQHLNCAERLTTILCQLPAKWTESANYVNVGGGFGFDYRTGQKFDWESYATGVQRIQKQLISSLGREIELRFEVGRGLVANHGALVARVLDAYVKAGRRYLVIDVSCSDLPRPIRMGFSKSFFPFMEDGGHRIDLVGADTFLPFSKGNLEVSVVGNSHYSKDWIGLTQLASFEPHKLREAYVVVRDVGAYCEVLRDNWTETKPAKTVVVERGIVREAIRVGGDAD